MTLLLRRQLDAAGGALEEPYERLARSARMMHIIGLGTPYRADDPEPLLWILFTLVDSGMVIYCRAGAGSTRIPVPISW